jgi:hypothetical protein
MFSVVPHSVCCLSLLHITFIMLIYDLSIHSFFMSFIMKGYWIFSKAVSAILRWSRDICSWFYLCALLPLLTCVCWIICNSWNETSWSWCRILKNCVLNSFCKNSRIVLLRNSAVNSFSPGLFFYGRLFYLCFNDIAYNYLGCLSPFGSISLNRMCLEIHPFLLDFPTYLNINF